MQPQNHFYQTLLHRHSQDESDIVEHCLLCFQNVHKQEDIFLMRGMPKTVGALMQEHEVGLAAIVYVVSLQ